MQYRMNHKGVPTLLAACLGLGVVTPLALFNTSCSQPSKDKASSTHSNISSFLVANSLTVPSFPSPSIGTTNALDATVGDAPWLVPNFSNVGGGASITPAIPGVSSIISGVPVQLPVLTQTGTSTYLLTVTDATGATTTANATVTAWAKPDATITADASVVNLTTGLTASVPAADSCKYSWTIKSGIITSAANTPSITYTSGPVGTTTLSCTVTNKAKATASQNVEIKVLAHPPAGFSYPMGTGAATFFQNIPVAIQIPNMAPGDPLTTFSVSPALPAGLSLDPSSGVISGTPTASAGSQTYVVTGSNSGGSSTTSLTFAVATQPAVALIASPADIGLGGGTILSWFVDGSVASITVDNGLQTTPLSTTSTKTGSFNVGPNANTTYTLTANLVGGGTAQATVTVTVDTTVLQLGSFTTDAAQVNFDGATILRWSLTGTPSALYINGDSVLGTNTELIHPVRRQTYTLSGSNGLNAANTISQSLTVAAQGLDNLAGNVVSGGGSQDGTGANAQFNGVNAMTMDSNHNIYVTDQKNSAIRKIAPGGVVTTISGTPGKAQSTDNAVTAKAYFNAPTGIAITPAGNIFVVDSGSGALRVILASGGVVTVTGVPTWSSPYSVAVASEANSTAVIYVGTSATSGAIYKLSVALTPTSATASQVASWTTGIGKVYGLTYVNDSHIADTLYIADDGKDCIRTIVGGAAPTILAGTSGSYGFKDGAATTTGLFNYPTAVAVDSSTNTVYVADEGNNAVRKISNGQVTTITGAATQTSGSTTTASPAGATNGTIGSATFRGPMGLVLDGSTLYVSESYFTGGMANNDVRTIDVSGSTFPTTTYAGGVPIVGSADGTLTSASFNTPFAVAVDSKRNTYVTDTANHTIRMVTSAGVVTTIAGTAGTSGSSDAPAMFKSPQGIAVDAAGNLYVADTGNHTIRMLAYNSTTNSYACSTIAGTASAAGGYAEGTGTAALFKSPRGLAVNAAGNMLFVADSSNNRVRMLTYANNAWTSAPIAGTGTATAAGDNSGKSWASGSIATLSTPYGVAFDGSTNLYVAEYGGDVVKQIVLAPAAGPFTAASSTVNQIAGKGSGTGNYGFANTTQDGTLTISAQAMFNYPQGIALDPLGNLFVADQGNNAIREIMHAGANGTWLVYTVVGANAPGGPTGTAPGILPASLWSPQSVASTPDGDLVITTNGGIAQATAPQAPVPTKTGN